MNDGNTGDANDDINEDDDDSSDDDNDDKAQTVKLRYNIRGFVIAIL